jgi:hypothetical protein
MSSSDGSATSGPELIEIAYRALTEDEQEYAYCLVSRARVEVFSREERTAQSMLHSMRVAALEFRRKPKLREYQELRQHLVTLGVKLEPAEAIREHFGSWRQACEALELREPLARKGGSPRRDGTKTG